MATTFPDSLICGVDDRPHAARVVAVATALAERLGVRLRLVHSVHPDVFLAGDERRDALRRGEALLNLLSADHAADRVVALGDPAELLQEVVDEGAALAVVGSRGRGSARAALVGSVSGALAGSSQCPVVVVSPHAAMDIAPEPTIVCGVDGSPDADAALEQAASLASTLGGRLLAVHVRANAFAPHATSLMPGRQPFSGSVDEARAAVATLERPLAHLDVDVPIGMRLETGYVAVRLAAVAAQQPGSILVVGSRGRGALQAAVFGSVSSRLAASAPVPVMIVPPAPGD